MTHPIVGTNSSQTIEARLYHLWRQRNNRFSYDYSWCAKIDGHVAGIVTALPVQELERIEKHTVWQLIKMRGFDLIHHLYHYFSQIRALLALKEGYQDEYHISLLAIMPEYHRQGVATHLLAHVEQFAKHLGYRKLSLTVKKDNDNAIRAYQKSGFMIVNEIDEAPYHLYRMMKTLEL
nr:GNAT family N-acetyltransferase [Staphylococcus canis]